MSSTDRIEFNSTSNSLGTVSSSQLKINALTLLSFGILGNTEMTMSVNQLEFDNGGTNTALYWGTAAQLDFLVGATGPATLISDGILLNPIQGPGATARLRFESPTGASIYWHTDSNAINIDSNVLGAANINAATFGSAGDIVLGDSSERTMRPDTDAKINLGNATRRMNNIHSLGELRLYEGPTGPYTALAGPTGISANLTLKLPAADGPTAESPLVTDSAGRLSFRGKAMCSVTTDEDASGVSGDEYNIFADANYSGTLDFTDNVTQTGITFTSSNGEFVVDEDGDYFISCMWNLTTSSNDEVDLIIKVNDTKVYDHFVEIIISDDPTMFTVNIIKHLSGPTGPGGVISFHTGANDGVDTFTAVDGTTATIYRI